MLFMLDHTHTPENCPCGSTRRVKDFDEKVKRAAKASGATLEAAYSDWGTHHFYFIVEAKTLDQLSNFVSPYLTDIGITHVHPINKWKVRSRA
jgi:Domain of unknown function (DUF3303)